MSGLRENGPSTLNCSTGWPSSSAKRLGCQARREADGHVGSLPARLPAPARTGARSTRTTACWPGTRRAGSKAEFVRDNALAVAGLLNLEVGGPGAHPYQPDGYYANLQFPGPGVQRPTHDRPAVSPRGLHRTGSAPSCYPMLANFDAPSREEWHRLPAIGQHAAAGP